MKINLQIFTYPLVACLLFVGIESAQAADPTPQIKETVAVQGDEALAGKEKIKRGKAVSKQAGKSVILTSPKVRKREIDCPQAQQKAPSKCVEILVEYQ